MSAEPVRGDAGPEALSSLPFGRLLWPVVRSASDTLALKLVALGMEVPDPCVLDDLHQHLVQQLANLCELPIYQALINWRNQLLADDSPAGVRNLRAILSSNDLEPFESFMKKEGIQTLVRQMPVLFRLIATLKSNWIAYTLELLRRLSSDFCLLPELDPRISTRSRLTGIQPGLSDPHNEGGTVALLEFDGTSRILYKPKDLGTDLFMREFLETLRRMNCPIPLWIPPVISRKEYGWALHVAEAPCESDEAIRIFYTRAGAWLAICHLLAITDMHFENFVAHGSTPVPIDFETILQPEVRSSKRLPEALSALWQVNFRIANSPLSAGMLPTLIQAENEEQFAIGALEPCKYKVNRVHWTEINTPRMEPVYRTNAVEISSHLPKLLGKPISILSYRAEFMNGFRTLMDFAADRRDELAHIRYRSARFATRRVLRPTRFYYLLLDRLRDHTRMADSVAWSMEADFTTRFLDPNEEISGLWSISRSERRALCNLDIPSFYCTPRTASLFDNRGMATRIDALAGLKVMSARIGQLSREVVREQEHLVSTALGISRSPRNPTSCPAFQAVEKASAEINMALWAEQQLNSAGTWTNGSAAWMTLEGIAPPATFQLRPTGHDLYGGNAGIAVFYSALAKCGVSDSARAKALLSLAATRHLLSSGGGARYIRSAGLGAGTGIGSIIYALCVASDLLQSESVLESAKLAARLITSPVISTDTRFDLIGGASGAILGLLKLYSLVREEWLLDLAIKCGDHLASHRPATNPWGIWSSSTFLNQPLTGVAHGAAGYALAFSRLFSQSKDDRFKCLATECVSFENHWFDRNRGEWPDLRADQALSGRRWPRQWCYGATGIGYSRLSMRNHDCIPRFEVENDILRAIELTREEEDSFDDTLCCGLAGHIDFLVAAASQFPELRLQSDIASRLSHLLSNWTATGFLRLGDGPQDYKPGFFRGIAGVGYACLRASQPNLPAILIWE
ncbi:MAG: type 2 lanthipeptide synthetase LanM family protein [Terracidiphilus sp.]